MSNHDEVHREGKTAGRAGVVLLLCGLLLAGCSSSSVSGDGDGGLDGADSGPWRDIDTIPDDGEPPSDDYPSADGAESDAAGDSDAGQPADDGDTCGDHCAPFSIVLLPDTQYYTSKQADGDNNTYYRQMQWIIDHLQDDNILFAIHLGDITNNNTAEQWRIASQAHALLDEAGVPYSVLPGNHDYLVNGHFKRNGSLMGDYFPPSRFAGKAWYGGHYGTDGNNSFAYFSNGGQRFLVLSLEYAPRKDVLCWARDVIEAHPDHHVIVATHCYLTHGGGYAGCPTDSYDTLGASGRDLWEELIAPHSNVFMVVSGHVGDSEHRLKTSNTGRPVHEILVDYQFEGECGAADSSLCSDNCRTGMYHGNGWMRQVVFDPDRLTVRSRTLTVEEGNERMFPGGQPAFFCSELRDPTATRGGNWYSADPTAPDHQYTFTYDFVSPPSQGVDTEGRLAFIDRTVNSTAAGNQIAPATAMSAGGDFVVAWEDDSDDSDGAGNHDVFVRGFVAGGCESFPDLRVNPDAGGHQARPRVAVDAVGDSVVVWEDDSDGNGVFQIKARGFSADGSEHLAPMTINTVAEGQQRTPAVAMTPGGNFVVVWQDDSRQDGGWRVRMRAFTAGGSELFAERNVTDDDIGERILPVVGVDDTGDIVVVWQDDGDGNGFYQIHARGFDPTGRPRFDVVTVNGVATGQQQEPSLAVSEDGSFVVVWRDDNDKDGNFQIMARGFLADGTARFADLAVSSSSGQHLSPVVACGPAGRFTVAWADDSDGNGSYQIHAASYAADGTEAVAEWTVNRVAAGQQRNPSAATNAAGTLVIAWQDDMDGNGVFQVLARGD